MRLQIGRQINQHALLKQPDGHGWGERRLEQQVRRVLLQV